MTISYLFSTAAKDNTVPTPTFQVGDLFVIYTVYEGRTTLPVSYLPDGWKLSNSTYSNVPALAQMVTWRVFESEADTIPVFPDATHICVMSYRCGEEESWLPPLSDWQTHENGIQVQWPSTTGSSVNPGYVDDQWYLRFGCGTKSDNIGSGTLSGWTPRAGTSEVQIRSWDSNGTITGQAASLGNNTLSLSPPGPVASMSVKLACLETLCVSVPPVDIYSAGLTGSDGVIYKISGGEFTQLVVADPTVGLPTAGLCLLPDGRIFTGDYSGSALVGTDGTVTPVNFSNLSFNGNGIGWAGNGEILYSTWCTYNTPNQVYRLHNGEQTSIILPSSEDTLRTVKSFNDTLYVLSSDGSSQNVLNQVDITGAVSTIMLPVGTDCSADALAVQENGTLYYYNELDYRVYSLVSGVKVPLNIKGLDRVDDLSIDQDTGDLYIGGSYGGHSPYIYRYSGLQQYIVENPYPYAPFNSLSQSWLELKTPHSLEVRR